MYFPMFWDDCQHCLCKSGSLWRESLLGVRCVLACKPMVDVLARPSEKPQKSFRSKVQILEQKSF